MAADLTADLTIGQVAEAAGCKVQTVRYYEEVGLVPRPPRTIGNQRRYGMDTVARLRFIRHARGLGFPLQAVRDLIGLADQPERPCAAVDAIAQEQLVDVERRLARLRSLKRELERMIEQCAGGRVRDCRVLEALAEPADTPYPLPEPEK